ncbi:MAG: aminotransferase class I and II [Chitinophagaceae bacterium]|nr:aminotransferase class I and II [Chitinophagaceae bacterium]
MRTPTISIRTTQVMRYVTPLREGGSLPAIVECEDGFLYVLKFRGAGQGPKALVAELVGGELARAAGLKVPEIIFAELDPKYGKSEPDQEIQDLLKASEGLNLGLHFLSGSIMYDPVSFRVDSLLASKIIWLDAFLMNVDRTVRNTNMLVWKNELWLIDHGASLYFHHSWGNWEEQSVKPFVQVKDHVLLTFADSMDEADAFMRAKIHKGMIDEIVSLIPDGWLSEGEDKSVYARFLENRLGKADIFVTEINHARKAHF